MIKSILLLLCAASAASALAIIFTPCDDVKTPPQVVEVYDCEDADCVLDMNKHYYASVPFIPRETCEDVFYLNGQSACDPQNGLDCPLRAARFTFFGTTLDKTTISVSENVGTFELVDEKKKSVLCFKVPVKN